MKTGILITARLGSTRLSRKHLKVVEGKPIVSYLIERIHNAFETEISEGSVKIFIATGRNPINKDLENVSSLCSIFYGNDNNIPLRHLETAEANGLDAIVSIDGDDILCSTSAMKMVTKALLNGHDIVKTSGLPLGLNVMGYRRSSLEKSLEDVRDSALETGWGRIFDSGKTHEIPINSYDHEELRFTLDYDLDFDFFSRIISELNDRIFRIKDEELIDFVMKGKIFEINSSIAREYWDNFNRNVDSEKESNREG